MKRRCLLLSLLLILFISNAQIMFSQTGPGGVGDITNTKLWLRADKGVFTLMPLSYVWQWKDQSGNGRDFVPIIADQPVPNRILAALNGYPVITFDDKGGVDGEFLGNEDGIGISGSDAATVVIVARNTTGTDEQNAALYIGQSGVGNPGEVRQYGLEYNDAVRFNGEAQVFNNGHTMGDWKIVQYSNPSGATVADYEAWLSGTSLTGSSPSSTVPMLSDGLMLLGASQNGGVFNSEGYFDGDIAEILVFSEDLNDATKVVLDNHLGAKYNIPISDDHFQYESTHYYDVSGIAAFNATTFTNGWSTTMLSINSPTDLSEGEYLFYGHNNGNATSWVTTEVPASGTYRLAREWRVDETGNVGTVTVTIPSSALPARPVGYDRIAILTDADGDFTSGTTIHEAKLIAGNYYVDVDFTSGQHIAIICFRPEISFSVSSASGLESVTNVTVQVELNYPYSIDAKVNYGVTGGTATNGTDYNLPASIITIPAGSVSNTFNFTVIDDYIVEDDEDLIVTISNPSAGVTIGAKDTYTYTIIDNDHVYVSLSAATASENEGNAARAVLVPTLSVSAGILATPGTVTLTVTNGTATSDDWSQTTAVITIPAGDYTTPVQISIPAAALSILGDNTVENDETINLSLTSFTLVEAGLITACTYTIINDDNATVSVTATTPTVTEGGPAPVGTGTYTFTLSNPSDIARTVTYTVGGTATSATDYVSLPGTIVIPANTTSVTATLTTVADILVEGDETVSVIITAISGTPAITVDATPAVMTIVDDDLPVILYDPSSLTINEGASGTVDVWLQSPPVTPVTIKVSTIKVGLLTVGPATLTFTTANYSTHQTITVQALEDNVMGDKTDDIILSVDDAISDDQFDPLSDIDIPVNIINNDIADILVSPLTVTVNENGTATFSVTLSAGPASGNVVIDLVSNDLAVATIDLSQLTFNTTNWNVPQIVTVTGVNNFTIPNTSTTISLAVNNALSDDNYDNETATVNVNVINDDIAGFTVSPLTLNISESGPAGTFTIVLNAQPIGDVVFDLTNAAPAYVTFPAQVTFTAANWNVPQIVTVTPIDDALDEDHTDYIVISVNQAASDDSFDALASQTVTINIDDNDPPVITGCPSNITVSSDAGQCSAVVSWTAPVSTGPMTSTHNPGDTFPQGTTTVTYTSTDDDGTSTCSFTVTVNDTEAPVISCPANLTAVPADAGVCYATSVSLGTPVTSDNCGIASVTNNAPAQFPLGTTTVTWTVTDNAGLTAQCTQNVTVIDTQAPTITCPANLINVQATADCEATGVSLGTPVTSDNCGVASVTNNAPAQFPLGTTVVVWTVTDNAGLTATCTQNVTVVDTEAPTITCPADMLSVPTNAGQCYAAGFSLGTPVTSDNCTVASVTNNAPAQFPIGVTVVTWTVTDNSGLTATCNQNVQVVDNQKPTIVCPPNKTLIPADPGVCYATGVSLGTPVTSDNCGVASVTNDAPAQYPVGTTIVTWTVTDTYGNVNTCAQSIQVVDTQSPMIICPGSLTSVSPDPGLCYATGVAIGTPITSDNCGVLSVTNNAPVQYPIGITSITWVVTDVHGHTATCVQTVEVIDDQAPTITCPADLTGIVADAGSCFATGVALGAPVTSDNCGSVTVTNNAPAQFPVGTTTVVWTATDNNGLSSTCNQLVNVVDAEAPAITCPANLTAVPADAGLCYATSVALGSPVATDNCGVASVTNDAPAQFPLGTTTVTWTVTDNGGLTASCTQSVTVVDTQLPSVTCPPDITGLSPDAGSCYATGVVLGTPVTSDNCGVATVTNDAPSQYPIGNTTVTWTVTDINGLVNTCSQLVQVVDDQPPLITCPPDIAYLPADAGYCYASSVAPGTPVTSDNCGSVTVTNDAPVQFPVGTTTVTWTATDGGGLTSSCTQQVTVVDIQLPQITCPANLTAIPVDAGMCYATGVSLGTPVTSDNCGVATVTNDAPAQFPVGTTTVTWTVTDINGYTASCTQTIEVVDTEQPLITCPADITGLALDPGSCFVTGVSLGTPVTSDNCGILSVTNNAPAQFPAGITTVVWTVTDVNGLTATCSQTVEVVDSEAPTITCPADLTAVPSDPGKCYATAVSLGTPVTSDNCGIASVTNDAPAQLPIGTTTVTWTVTDNAGLTSTCTQSVTVVDAELPVITCSSSVTDYPADLNMCYATGIVLDSPVTSDNCGVASVTSDAPVQFPVGTTTVTWTVTDVNGSVNTCSQIVEVIDTQSPLIVCPGNLTRNSSPGECGAYVTWADPIATDNCPGLVVTSTHSSGDLFPLGVTTVVYTATDGSGNDATCSFKVTVNDTEAPVIVPQDVTIYLDATGNATITVSDVTVSVTDNCTLTSTTLSKSAFSCSDIGPNTVTITATDNAGHITTATAIVTIVDNIPPVVTCQPVTAYLDATGNVTIDASDLVASSSDNCSGVTFMADIISFTCADLGDVPVVVTATDAGGNTAICNSVVTVADSITVNVSAGPDLEVCVSDLTVAVTAASVYNGTVVWSSSGTGTFDDPASISPVYTFGPGDNAGVTFTVVATQINGCNPGTDTDITAVTFVPVPVISAGADITTCESAGTVPITGATSTGGSVTWSTSGNGTFDDPTLLNPVYNIGSADAGIITLTMTVVSGTCPAVTDDMQVILEPSPDANPGPGGSLCESEPGFQVTGASHSGGSVGWTSSGDGIFDDNTSDNPYYAFGPNDLLSDVITLTMTVTGTGDCPVVQASINVNLLPAPGISVTAHDDISCNGLVDGAISITGIGGTPSYSYSIDGSAYQATGDFGSLTAGSHLLSVMDQTGCSRDTLVDIIDPDVFTYTLDTVINVECYGINSGEIDITPAGGTLPYNISWSGPNGYTSTAEDATALAPGTYSLIITDANGCNTYNLDVTVDGAPEIVVTVDTVSTRSGYNLTCFGDNDGFIETTISGGSGDLTIQWTGPSSFVSSLDDIADLEAGTYTLTVTDTSGCVVTKLFTLTQPDAMSADLDVQDASCPGVKDGSITVTTHGGAGTLAFLWSDGSTQQSRTEIESGNYTLTITDENGCTIDLPVTVDLTGYNCVVIPEIITPNGDGHNDTWVIGLIELYPNAEVKVYTRWGKLVYSSRNPGAEPWDGTFKGKLLPNDSYHYILYLNDGSEPRTGVISIISK